MISFSQSESEIEKESDPKIIAKLLYKKMENQVIFIEKKSEWYTYYPSKHKWVKDWIYNNECSRQFIFRANHKKIFHEFTLIVKKHNLFKNKNACDIFNKKINLIGFNNGVYDLSIGEFRKGQPNDYILNNTNTNYILYNPLSNAQIEIQKFLRITFTNNGNRNQLVKTISKFLDGTNKHKIHVFNGDFASGKTCVNQLIQHSFGSCCKNFCKQYNNGWRWNHTKYQLYDWGRHLLSNPRVAVICNDNEDDINEDDLINFDSLNLVFVLRNALFMTNINISHEFKQNVKIHKFTSKFRDNPKKGEFKMDRNLYKKTTSQEWREAFMSYLIWTNQNNRKLKILIPYILDFYFTKDIKNWIKDYLVN